LRWIWLRWKGWNWLRREESSSGEFGFTCRGETCFTGRSETDFAGRVTLASLVVVDLALPVAENVNSLSAEKKLWIWLRSHNSDMPTPITEMLALTTLTYSLLKL